MNPIHWQCKAFDELSLNELYSLLALRAEVFVVEQDCPYQDLDGKDPQCLHILGTDTNGDLLAYARIVPAGLAYEQVALGRIVTSPKVRRTGAGKQLMHYGLEQIEEKYGTVPIVMSAQCYLLDFYKSFGFVPQGEEYLEDGIPHMHMLLQP